MIAEENNKSEYRDLQGYWFKLDAWPLWAALAMLHGQHPDLFAEWDSASKDAVIGDALQMAGASISARKLPIIAAIPSGSIWLCEVEPSKFIQWAMDKDYQTQYFEALVAERKSGNYKSAWKEKARLVAKTLWITHPKMTIQELVKHPAMLEVGGGKYFSGANTVRDWIRDLDPRSESEKRGRRANKQLPSSAP